jgi:hypothetical protein
MNQPEPNKAGRVAGVVVCLICIIGAVIFAAWSRSLGSIIFATFVAVLFPVSLLRSWKLSEAEMMRRQDEAMKIKDDPNEMARWVP